MQAWSTKFLAVLTAFMALAPLHSTGLAGEPAGPCAASAAAQPADRGPDAPALADMLDRDGTVRLYTIAFTEDGTAVQPESRSTIDAVAALLHDQPTLQLFVVGHTDSAGLLPLLPIAEIRRNLDRWS